MAKLEHIKLKLLKAANVSDQTPMITDRGDCIEKIEKRTKEKVLQILHHLSPNGV